MEWFITIIIVIDQNLMFKNLKKNEKQFPILSKKEEKYWVFFS